MKNLIFLLLTIPILLFIARPILGQDLDKELSDIEKELEEVQGDYDNVSGDLSKINSEIAGIKNTISSFSNQINVTQAEINKVEQSINSLKIQLDKLTETLNRFNSVLGEKEGQRNLSLRSFYKKTQVSPIEVFLASVGFLDSAQKATYYKRYINEAISNIKKLNGEINNYNKQKEGVESAKGELESEKQKFESTKIALAGKVKSASAELSDLQRQANALQDQLSSISDTLGELSAKQQDILKKKFGASEENLTVGDTEQAKQSLPNPGFSPAYAFFSRGYPHRVNMSQYGAKGRAENGQSYEEILEFYYPNTELEGECDEGAQIEVQGYGTMGLEEYLYGLGEMPSDWPMDALKAQAVAGRSYALNYTQSRGAICTTQSCQVYIGHSKGGRWEEAVNATCGQILTYDGSPITAWYASTAGGYIRSSADVWGGSRPWSERAKDFACNGSWEECSYDGPNYGDSPWFHKAWGKGTNPGPWLDEEQAEDMFNAYLLYQEDSGNRDDLSPVDQGGISESEVIERLGEGNQVGAITNIETYDDGQGYTTTIKVFSANYPSGLECDGYEFKSIFNLRAPGTVVLWTSFYDVLRQ